MVDVHPDAELAPRDVVSRAVWQRQQQGRQTFLYARHLPGVTSRFPTVAAHARSAGLDPTLNLLPISPAVHYSVGGVEADGHGRTTLGNLWAVGEVAATGVHGANRLASNSLLEGVVFAARTARDVATNAAIPHHVGTAPEAAFVAALDEMGEINELRDLMWDQVGIVRTRAGLEGAARRIGELEPTLSQTIPGRAAVEVAAWISAAAMGRPESCGGHFRADFPRSDPAHQGQRHTPGQATGRAS